MSTVLIVIRYVMQLGSDKIVRRMKFLRCAAFVADEIFDSGVSIFVQKGNAGTNGMQMAEPPAGESDHGLLEGVKDFGNSGNC